MCEAQKPAKVEISGSNNSYLSIRENKMASLRFYTPSEVGQMRSAVFHQKLEVEVVGESQSRVKVAIIQTPINESVVTKSIHSWSNYPQDFELHFKYLPFERTENVYLMEVYNLREMYFQFPKYQVDLDQVMENIQLAAEHAEKFEGVIVMNVICLAKRSPGDLNYFNNVDKWYRAKVINYRAGNKYYVEFMDFGDRDAIHHSNIRRIPKHLVDIPIFALPCCLANHPDLEIPEKVLEEFNYDAMLYGNFKVELIKSKDEPWNVDVKFIDRRGVELIERCLKKAAVIDRFQNAILSGAEQSSSDDSGDESAGHIKKKIRRYYEKQSLENSDAKKNQV